MLPERREARGCWWKRKMADTIEIVSGSNNRLPDTICVSGRA